MDLTRRGFVAAGAAGATLPRELFAEQVSNAIACKRLNVILCMTDDQGMTGDQGWGDVGDNGHPELRTPHLDQMSTEGIRLERLYAGAPRVQPELADQHPQRVAWMSKTLGEWRASCMNNNAGDDY